MRKSTPRYSATSCTSSALFPGSLGYFHAQFNTGHNKGPDPVQIADAQGAGHYAGCLLYMQGEERNYLSFLEAPEYVYVDDDWEAPRIVGTGLEDYFLGGWYFREGPFIGPFHGVPVKDTLNASVAMYRVHEADAIHFRERFKFAFVNPWAPDRLQPFCFSSVAFLYLATPRVRARPSRRQRIALLVSHSQHRPPEHSLILLPKLRGGDR